MQQVWRKKAELWLVTKTWSPFRCCESNLFYKKNDIERQIPYVSYVILIFDPVKFTPSSYSVLYYFGEYEVGVSVFLSLYERKITFYVLRVFKSSNKFNPKKY